MLAFHHKICATFVPEDETYDFNSKKEYIYIYIYKQKRKIIRTHYQPNHRFLNQLKFLNICKTKQSKKKNSPKFGEFRFECEIKWD